MGAVYDDLPAHEGYSLDQRGGHVGACSCGWRDDVGAADYEAAVDRWDQQHAAALLERAVPLEVTKAVDRARRALADLARTRPKAATVALDDLERSVGRLRSLARDIEPGPPTIGERLAAVRSSQRARGSER